MAVTSSGKDKLMRHTRLYYGGYDLSGDGRQIGSLETGFEPVPMSGWSHDVGTYLVDGVWKPAVTGFQAFMNDTANSGAFTLLKTGLGSSRLSIAFGGGGEPAVGDPAFLMPSAQFNAPHSVVNNAWTVTADFMPDASQISANNARPTGVVLRGPTSLAATLTGSSSNSIDFGAASTAGWSANIHVLATASGNFAFKIRHSTDDSSYADLGTFTTTGGSIGSEHLTGSGSVNQYVAFDATRTAGTVTVVVTFTRN